MQQENGGGRAGYQTSAEADRAGQRACCGILTLLREPDDHQRGIFKMETCVGFMSRKIVSLQDEEWMGVQVQTSYKGL